MRQDSVSQIVRHVSDYMRGHWREDARFFLAESPGDEVVSVRCYVPGGRDGAVDLTREALVKAGGDGDMDLLNVVRAAMESAYRYATSGKENPRTFRLARRSKRYLAAEASK